MTTLPPCDDDMARDAVSQARGAAGDDGASFLGLHKLP